MQTIEKKAKDSVKMFQDSIDKIESEGKVWVKEVERNFLCLTERIDAMGRRDTCQGQNGEVFHELKVKPNFIFSVPQKQNPVHFLKYFERKYGSILSDKSKFDIFE